nr:autotransporter domain-containing protein [uncultured Cohaesibacter sp.]
MVGCKVRSKPLGAIVALGTAVLGFVSPSHAGSSDLTISTTSSDIQVSSGESLNSITVTETGVVSGANDGVYNNGNIGTITNLNKLGAGYYAIRSSGTIGTISNAGTLSSDRAYAIYNTGTINELINTGSITADWGYTILNNGTITNFNNSGTITAGSTSTNVLNNTGSIDSFTNSGTIKGDITSGSSLTFIGGSGSTLGVLTGYTPDATTAIGAISISSGDLVFASGNMLLNDNVTMGSGSVINQAAALQINNSVSVIGDFVQESTGTLLIGVADGAVATGNVATDSGYGRLVVTDTATFNSGSIVYLTSLNSYAFAEGQRYVVAQADAIGTNYNASSLIYGADGYSGAITGLAQVDSNNSNLTDLVITLGNSGPTGRATTQDAIASMNGLFNYGGTDSGLLNVFNASAALGTSPEANKAGAQLSPAAVTSASTKASSSTTTAVLNVIGQRADKIRALGAGNSGVATGESMTDAAVWGQGFGGMASQQERDAISGYDARFGGFLIGADAAFDDSWRVGGLGSYARTFVDGNDSNEGSTVGINSYGLFGYASYDGNPWFLDISTGVALHTYDTHREFDFGGFRNQAEGSFNGWQYAVSGQAGYPFQLNDQGTTLTPIAGLSYSLLWQDGYTETGGGGAALTVDDATSTSLKSNLGVRLDHTVALPKGELSPFVQVGWSHEFHDGAQQSAAGFAADGTGATDFVTTGARPIADSLQLAIGATLKTSDNLSLSLKYAGEMANSYQSHTGNLQLRLKF